jgi:hypothetical protein
MRESVFAFAPLAAVLYFTFFPNQFSTLLFWMTDLLH